MGVHYYPLINKIMTRLRLFDRDEDIASLAQSSFPQPFITVAREPGSGGAPIAELVAEKLDYEFVDEQIIESIANSTEKRAGIIKKIDERSRNQIQDMVHSLLNDEYVSDVEYLSELVKVILAFATQGHVVILGRGANFITPFARGLHVNVTAPYDVRVQRAMDYEGHTKARAKEIIAKVEEERAKFVKQYMDKDIEKRNAYDLTLNTTYFDVGQAADTIIETFHQKFPQKKRYKQVIDSVARKL